MGAFYRLGKADARFPVRVSLAALACSLVLCLGLRAMQVQTDPQALWVAPSSVAAQEQAKFNELFHPFFRIQQLIFYVDEASVSSEACDMESASARGGPTCNATADLIQKRFLLQMAEIQQQITDAVIVTGEKNETTLSLQDFCYRPIRGKGCLVTSPFQYWQGNASILANDPDIKLTTACQTTDPILKSRSPCMDQNGVPVMSTVVFGGISRDSCHGNPDPCGETTKQAKALMVTFLLNNNLDNATYTELVQQWEQDVFLKIAAQAAQGLKNDSELNALEDSAPEQLRMKLTYMAQRSIADSLIVQTSQNAFIVILSYLIMFLYVSMSLGKWSDPLHSRYGLGITGIFIVLLSLGIAMGISCAILQMEVTMITLEVVPFLILAIGVDNMFILTNEFDRLKALRGLGMTTMHRRDRAGDDEILQQVLGETLTNVGPSITVAAIAESLAFLVGALTRIPALESFCIVASIAVLADFVLQITWFAAALVLDTKRVRARRYDLFPWVRQSVKLSPDTVKKQRMLDESLLSSSPTEIAAASTYSGPSVISSFVEKRYLPWLKKPSTKLLVVISMFGCIAVSVLGYPHLHLGLEQELAVPSDFYLHEYFKMQTKYGEAGPPAYAVLEGGVDYTDGQVQQNVNSLLDSFSSVREYVQLPIYSWLHTFNQWRQMRYFLQDKITQDLCDCPVQPLDPFPYEVLSSHLPDESNATTPNELFYPLVQNFTAIPIDSQCCQQFGLCGAQYEGDVIFTRNESTYLANGIQGSRMRFQMAAMTNQSMFVNSYYYLHQITEKWTAKNGHKMRAFPYTLYFVYYEQYTYIQGVALQSILLALAVVFICITVLMDFNLRLSLLVTICVLCMTLTQLGFLFVWNSVSDIGTSINAVSVVNLLACVGLGVEFCVHTAHQFAFSQRNRLGITAMDHTKHAVTRVGPSIISGITLTKFCGIGVLAFAPSMLFRVYFFRMYMGIVVLGFYYGLVVMPVLLSLFGQRDPRPDDEFSSFLLSEERDEDDLDLGFDAY